MPSAPQVHLAPLPRADGSAAFSHNGFKILSSVNGPIEATKKDEAAFEATVDVVVRPAAGVGGTRERHLESLISSTLRAIVPVKNFPRCLIQIVLQITETPENAYENAKITQAQAYLPAIPALLHSAILGLMSAAIPLNCLASAVLLAIPQNSDSSFTIITDPTAVQVSRARSVHVFGFTSTDQLLLAESEGSFTPAELKAVMEQAKKVCCQAVKEEMDLDVAMEGVESETVNMTQFMRSVMVAKVKGDLHWKAGV